MADDKKLKRTRRSAVIYAPIAALLILILVIFGIGVFFRISDVQVKGAKKYTVQQIVSASGIKTGDNLVFIDPYAAAGRIMETLPYLSEVDIEKIVPNKVSINVVESQPMAVIRMEGAWWLIDQKARVLEGANNDTAAKKIEVIGLSPRAIKVGKQMSVDDSDKTKLLYLTYVLAAIEEAGFTQDVTMVDVTEIGRISFKYLDRFTVIMGSGEDADFKLIRMQSVLQSVLHELEPDEKGKIDVSDDTKSRFIRE